MTQLSTPAADGYRFPAEWEPHAGTWLSWPKNRTDWPGKMTTIYWVYAEIIRKIGAHERVNLFVDDQKMEETARRILERADAPLAAVTFWRMPTDRSWSRDFGPMQVVGKKGAAVVDFHFNGWAKYRDWTKDTRIAGRVAKKRAIPLYEATMNGRPMVIEGGGVEVNGRGTLITTEECFMDPTTQVRNRGASKADYARAFADYLAATNIIWLNRGVVGDDTHGHVDDLCRFVNPTTLVLAVENDPTETNYAPLRENRERLQTARLETGDRPEVVELPMPRPLYYDGNRLPASYANFYIANGAVIVPTFNDPADRIALGVLQELIPDRTVVGVHAVDLVWGLGTLHCLTQQDPATP